MKPSLPAKLPKKVCKRCGEYFPNRAYNERFMENGRDHHIVTRYGIMVGENYAETRGRKNRWKEKDNGAEEIKEPKREAADSEGDQKSAGDC